MFGHRYFGARYFGPRYWGPSGATNVLLQPLLATWQPAPLATLLGTTLRPAAAEASGQAVALQIAVGTALAPTPAESQSRAVPLGIAVGTRLAIAQGEASAIGSPLGVSIGTALALPPPAAELVRGSQIVTVGALLSLPAAAAIAQVLPPGWSIGLTLSVQTAAQQTQLAASAVVVGSQVIVLPTTAAWELLWQTAAPMLQPAGGHLCGMFRVLQLGGRIVIAAPAGAVCALPPAGRALRQVLQGLVGADGLSGRLDAAASAGGVATRQLLGLAAAAGPGGRTSIVAAAGTARTLVLAGRAATSGLLGNVRANCCACDGPTNTIEAAAMLILHPGEDNSLVWDNLNDAGTAINNATVTFALKDPADAVIASGSLAYVASSAGNYKGALLAAAPIVAGKKYFLELTAAGTPKGFRRIPCFARWHEEE